MIQEEKILAVPSNSPCKYFYRLKSDFKSIRLKSDEKNQILPNHFYSLLFLLMAY